MVTHTHAQTHTQTDRHTYTHTVTSVCFMYLRMTKFRNDLFPYQLPPKETSLKVLENTFLRLLRCPQNGAFSNAIIKVSKEFHQQ